MLEDDYRANVARLLSKLPCSVRIPKEWGDFFAVSGPLPTVPDDRRRYARRNCRGQAILEVRPSLPGIERKRGLEIVYLRDLSREGISFVRAGQLYPSEDCTLWLPKRKVPVRVVRCRRFNSRCYVIGARIATFDTG